MSQLTFQMDRKTEAILEELMKVLDAPSKASALRTALALAGAVAAEIKDDSLVIRDQERNEDIRIKLLGIR